MPDLTDVYPGNGTISFGAGSINLICKGDVTFGYEVEQEEVTDGYPEKFAGILLKKKTGFIKVSNLAQLNLVNLFSLLDTDAEGYLVPKEIIFTGYTGLIFTITNGVLKNPMSISNPEEGFAGVELNFVEVDPTLR